MAHCKSMRENIEKLSEYRKTVQKSDKIFCQQYINLLILYLRKLTFHKTRLEYNMIMSELGIEQTIFFFPLQKNKIKKNLLMYICK